MTDKEEGAFKTIGELSKDLNVPQHILRYWETRFSQLKPLTRAGNRRYYRPSDVSLVHRIHDLLYKQGYTVKGVQKLLSSRAAQSDVVAQSSSLIEPTPIQPAMVVQAAQPAPRIAPELLAELKAVRARLAAALSA